MSVGWSCIAVEAKIVVMQESFVCVMCSGNLSDINVQGTGITAFDRICGQSSYGFFDHRICQSPDAIDLNGDFIARL